LIEERLAPPPTKAHVSVARPARWWYVACRSTALRRRPLARRLLGMPLVLFRDAGGQPAALLDRCPHRNLPLSLGRVLASGRLECAYHGWQLDASGRCPHGAWHRRRGRRRRASRSRVRDAGA
jgi:phenylpropionate dioxygenase-like ring-hydroxylating dioxygenase large terminal subunit